MNKKCLFLLCVVFITQTKSDTCFNDFLKCFSEFADAFFQNVTDIESIAPESIPNGFKQVKDIEIKTIQELTDSLQAELLKQSNLHSNAVVVTDNPKTQIYVKTYYGNFFENIPGFDKVNVEINHDNKDEKDKGTAEDVKEHVNIKNTSLLITQNNDIDAQETTTENISTISLKTTIANTNDDETKVTLDNQPLTTQIPDINKNIHEQKTTIKHTEKVETELPQKDLSQKISTANITNASNIITKQKTVGKSTPNRKDETLKNNQFEKDIRENIIQTDDEIDYDIEDSTDYPQIDYIDLYKDTTNEETEFVPTDSPKTVTIDIKDDIIEKIEEFSLDIDAEMDNETSVSRYKGYFGMNALTILSNITYFRNGT